MIKGLKDTERVLAVAAHPDDLDFSCGGTLCRLADAGASVLQVIATAGQAGSSELGATRDRIRDIRTEEAVAAGATIGCDVRILGFEDGYVEPSIELRRDLSREIRMHRPGLVLCMDPRPILGGWFINHPDHRAVAQATLDSLITGGPTRLVHPELLEEGLEPWKPLQVMLYGPDVDANFAVDISSTLERKAKALACHRSQVADVDAFELLKGIAERSAEGTGHEFAEKFHLFDVAP